MTRFFLPCAALAAITLVGQSADTILGKLDASGPSFRNVQAQVKKVTFTAIVNDLSEETGTITLTKSAKELKMLAEFEKPDPRAVAFAGRKVEIYYPKMQTIQVYDLGKQKGLVDQFLLVGFGATGRDLRAAYDIKYGGDETIAGEKAGRLELIPKSEEARKHVRRIELWIAYSHGQPVQQKVWQNARDYTSITYSGMKINGPLREGQTRLNTPPGVKREYPQK